MTRQRAILFGLISPVAMAGALCVACAARGAPAMTADERLVHRFLRVEISPDAALVASVEGDSPVGGFYPRFATSSSGVSITAPQRR